jgi:hypothetical protein
MTNNISINSVTPSQTVIDKKHNLAVYKQELANIRDLLNNNTLSDIELRRLKQEAELLEKKIYSLNMFLMARFITRFSKL